MSLTVYFTVPGSMAFRTLYGRFVLDYCVCQRVVGDLEFPCSGGEAVDMAVDGSV
jgi:hypothetical protein